MILMPSKRRQMNIRLDDETEAEFNRLRRDLSKKIGLELSQSAVFRLAVRALAKENPPDHEKKGKR